MKIRIFIPKTIYHYDRKDSIFKNRWHDHNCDYIFGKIFCNEKSITIYIIEQRKCSDQLESVDLIGQISYSPTVSVGFPLNYIYFEQMENILKIKSINTQFRNNFDVPNEIQFFLYDLKMFTEISKIADANDEQKLISTEDPISELLSLIRLKDETVNNDKSQPINSFLIKLSTAIQSKLSKLESTLLSHFVFWSTNLQYNLNSDGYIWTIIFDVISGVAIMLCLWNITDADDYFMKFTTMIVRQLQLLLDGLSGSPVGLKLNIELNNFFLACFRYHVELWATFLIIITPLVKYLFVPLTTVMGCLGLSFQLSILVDLLNVVTLHCHCIYVYASILYRIEIDGLLGFWRIVSGRRKNLMKSRIEGYDYTNPQLYLSAIFFTALLFLLPTFLVYYIVFASLRSVFYYVTFILTLFGRKILALPVFHIFKWIFQLHVNCDKFRIIHLGSTTMQSISVCDNISLFSIGTLQNSFPSWISSVVFHDDCLKHTYEAYLSALTFTALLYMSF